jgi:hypothetical protein
VTPDDPLDPDLQAVLDALGEAVGDVEVLDVVTNTVPPNTPPGWAWDWRAEPYGSCQRCPWPSHSLGPDGKPWHPFCWADPHQPVSERERAMYDWWVRYGRH